MARIPFTKMVGTGNDFVIIDAVHHRLNSLKSRWAEVARALCDRHRGIGADGVLLLEPSKTALVRMRVLNADGSEAEMCGNGARCVARYVQDWPGRRNGSLEIETLAGRVGATIEGERVCVRMPLPKDLRPEVIVRLEGHAYSGGFVNTGVPHFVVSVTGIESIDVAALGRALRRHADFAPKGTNVNFVEWVRLPSPRLRVRTYERGVEGETLACGTGMTAAAIIHGLRSGLCAGAGRTEVRVQPASGDLLTIGFRCESGAGAAQIRDVTMEGTARVVFEGECAWPPAAVRPGARSGRRA